MNRSAAPRCGFLSTWSGGRVLVHSAPFVNHLTSPSPFDEGAHPVALVLPLAALEDLISVQASRSTPLLAHGLFTLQSQGQGRAVALAGPLGTQPLASLWPDPRRPPRAADGVLLLHLSSGEAADTPADEAWLLQAAPAWRLATTLLRPALLVLRLGRQGGARVDWRSPQGHWHAVPRLEMPGARQRHLGSEIDPAPSTSRLTWSAEDDVDLLDPSDRDSRQRGGLGSWAHHRLQHGTLGLVGLGRTGASVATTAVRLGWRVLGLDPDVIEAHNLDADFLPLHEGWPKARALHKSLAPLSRPGTAPDLRALSIASPAAGQLVAHCDLGLLTMVDNLPSLVWASAWALATHRLHVCVATGIDSEGGLAETEIRVLQPGRGCPLCVGGLAEPLPQVLAQLARGEAPHTPQDFRRQRPGSVRSVSVSAGHLALRALEQVVQGRLRSSLFRRLRETAEGGLQVQEQHVWRAPEGCPFCGQFHGVGTSQVTHRRVLAAIEACAAWQAEGGSGAGGLSAIALQSGVGRR